MGNRQLGPQILQLRDKGHTYNQIVSILHCTKSVVSYHAGKGQKAKTRKRMNQFRARSHPYVRKIENFLNSKPCPNISKPATHQTRKLIQLKLQTFFFDRVTKMYQNPTITVEDIIGKFGDNPVCYLTGQPIDINKPRTYNFDHIIPVSRGGANTLDNLQICTKAANQAKHDMTRDEFINFCQLIVNYNKAAL